MRSRSRPDSAPNRSGTTRAWASWGAAERTESGYRTYSAADLECLRFIQGAKALGLSLAEIRDVVTTMDSGEQPCGKVSQFLDRKIGEMDRKIEEFVEFRDALRTYKASMDAAEPAGPVACRHIEGVQTGQRDTANQAPQEPLRNRCASEKNIGPLKLVKPGHGAPV